MGARPWGGGGGGRRLDPGEGGGRGDEAGPWDEDSVEDEKNIRK